MINYKRGYNYKILYQQIVYIPLKIILKKL